MTLRTPNSRIVRKPPKNAPALVQPSSRVCRYPGRDLLTGALIEAGADVRAVSEYEWYGPRSTRQKVTEYGPSLDGMAGIGRDLRDWAARHAAIERAQAGAKDEESA